MFVAATTEHELQLMWYLSNTTLNPIVTCVWCAMLSCFPPTINQISFRSFNRPTHKIHIVEDENENQERLLKLVENKDYFISSRPNPRIRYQARSSPKVSHITVWSARYSQRKLFSFLELIWLFNVGMPWSQHYQTLFCPRCHDDSKRCDRAMSIQRSSPLPRGSCNKHNVVPSSLVQ